jgi:hypothetical protein
LVVVVVEFIPQTTLVLMVDRVAGVLGLVTRLRGALALKILMEEQEMPQVKVEEAAVAVQEQSE